MLADSPCSENNLKCSNNKQCRLRGVASRTCMIVGILHGFLGDLRLTELVTVTD